MCTLPLAAHTQAGCDGKDRLGTATVAKWADGCKRLHTVVSVVDKNSHLIERCRFRPSVLFLAATARRRAPARCSPLQILAGIAPACQQSPDIPNIAYICPL